MLIKEILNWASNELKSQINYNSPLEARILLAWQLQATQEFLLINSEKSLSDDQFIEYSDIIRRRLLGEPIAYIIGTKEFYNRDFIVTPDVLIPRADSETLIDAVRENYALESALNILELGIGSGCLGITILLEFTKTNLHGTDISEAAIHIAQNNAKFHQVENRIKFCKSNWFEKIELNEYDMIISNPPYIAQEEQDLLSDETAKFEPKLALFSKSNDGLSSYREIAANAKNYLKLQGKIFLEVGYSQVNSVKEIFLKKGYSFDKSYKDLQKFERILVFIKNND